MSELFDSLQLSTSAAPSSSQQSSSQPSTSKVFWHASPSPGVLRQLANRTPSKSQDSPTLPLCTQAFVGELKKLPGALEAQSPLVARDSAKRKKLTNNSRGASRHVSDPTANKVKPRDIIEVSDEDEDEDSNGPPRRLLLGDVGESSPESTRRRTMDAGHTGRFRNPSMSSQQSSSSARPTLPQLNTTEKDAQQQQQITTSSIRRLDRRPPRRRKKESLIAGLGFTDDSGRATDCLKLFEDLQAALHMQNASRPSTSGSADQRPTVTFDQGSSEAGKDGRLTPREGIHRTTSAPSSSRVVQRSQPEVQVRSPQQQQQPASTTARAEPMTPNRVFRTVKSDHDVFRPAGQAQSSTNERALQPRAINVPQLSRPPSEPRQASAEPTRPAAISQHTQPKQHATSPAQQPQQPTTTSSTKSPAPRPVQTIAAASTSAAQPSPVKRSARIEAMQHSGKKLGVRAPSMLSKSVLPRNKPATTTRKVGSTPNAARTRTNLLPLGMSQARQVGLPRSCSQHATAPASQVAPSQHAAANPAAPFRPPGVAARVATTVRAAPARVPQASSDDSFGDDDDAAFLALACELEY